ncbi:MAG: 23S rRNA (adenine(2503)-C(2))-methyltransferase RlmN, partial [Verrucomicrobia bacterium]|nr:23S rRNA (adenine(2503)-C(2))-methyltransferase RlmN [Verrucomicrobiota bacterium]
MSGVAMKESIFGVTLSALGERLKEAGHPGYRAAQVMEWVYAKRVESFEAMSNLPAALRTTLSEELTLDGLKPVRTLGSEDTTRKYLFQLTDGALIESVLIPASPALYGEASDRRTLCVSTQVGCAYGCKFCASGLDGWSRNLSAGEIVGQIVRIEKLCGERVSNLVFMGMGEPLANYNAVIQSIRNITSPHPEGLGIGARSVTLSTVGLVPAIMKLIDEDIPVTLAVSLHAPDDELRDTLVPINTRWKVSEVLEAADAYSNKTGRRYSIEYALIRDINDQAWRADLLGRLLKNRNAHVNLIPLNPTPGSKWTASRQ